ncbi:MAG: type VI secretion system baseplate subunit TssG [Acetobacteraceae bacterium]|jgi:type VI secretion system protein ImpH|nr:type VI secretion system baseplate subunit TssG [Acetobacteraceae bacterium]
MASARRRTAPSVTALLAAEPQRFPFLEAMRVLEAAERLVARDIRREALKPLGGDADPAEEVARLSSALSLAFPAAEVASFRPEKEGEKARLVLAFLGLVGPGGILPRHYAELVLAAQRAKNEALPAFLDMFVHRALGLHLRAAKKYRLARLAEEAPPGAIDPVTAALTAIVGFRTDGLSGRLAVPDEVALHYGGLFSARPRSAARLEAMVADFLGRPVEVVQMVGAWLPLPPTERTRLPGSALPRGAHARLGMEAALGVRAWDTQGRFTLRLGPMPYAAFAALMPGGPSLARVVDLVRAYVGPRLGFSVNPVLAGDAVPAPRLGAGGDAAPRLGWNVWLPRSQRPGEGRRPDAPEAVFAAETITRP